VKIVFDRDENKELVQTEQRQRDAAAASSSSQARVGPETRALAVAAAAAGVEAFGGDGGAGAVPPGVTLAAPTFVSAPGPTTVRKEVVIKVIPCAIFALPPVPPPSLQLVLSNDSPPSLPRRPTSPTHTHFCTPYPSHPSRSLSLSLQRQNVRMSDVRLATFLGNPDDGVGYINLSGCALFTPLSRPLSRPLSTSISPGA